MKKASKITLGVVSALIVAGVIAGVSSSTSQALSANNKAKTCINKNQAVFSANWMCDHGKVSNKKAKKAAKDCIDQNQKVFSANWMCDRRPFLPNDSVIDTTKPTF